MCISHGNYSQLRFGLVLELSWLLGALWQSAYSLNIMNLSFLASFFSPNPEAIQKGMEQT